MGRYRQLHNERLIKEDFQPMTDRRQYLLDHIRKGPGPCSDECWLWLASLTNGYGQTYWNGVIGRAHVL
jgi:hypothetical protein